MLSLFNVMVFCTPMHPHEHFLKKNICQIISETKYDKFNSGMKLRCEWSKFLDENNKLVRSKQNYRDTEYIYDIVFTPSAVPSEIEKYKVVNSGLFSNIRLKSLSFQNLGIITIEEGAFDEFCCDKTLVTLDLSKNYMTRLNANSLQNLSRMTRLNLASNHLSLNENNFKSLRNLRYIDLSNNNIQYLPSNLFNGVKELELVNFSGNNLQNVDSCVFDSVQTSPLARKLYPTKIDLSSNPINCDCSLFYLARHRNYRVEAVCVSPNFYEGKQFSSLISEDPSKRCDYKRMEDYCVSGTSSKGLLYAVITLALVSGLFIMCTLICFCKYMSASSRAEKYKQELKRSKTKELKQETTYYTSLGSDKQKLIA